MRDKSGEPAGFIAINYITCEPEFCARFEHLFSTRARAIDRMPGFISMQVLKPHAAGEPYLIVSHWAAESDFQAWVGSPEFLEGHKRGFAELKSAKAKGAKAPMASSFKTYSLLTD